MLRAKAIAKQMVADQKYSGHSSIHDDAIAEKLGFRTGPIEGPTHFSQFTPLLAEIWGQAWFERGCFSADLEIRMIDGPLFIGEDYLIRREIEALSESRRSESFRVRNRIYDAGGETLKAEMLLNHAVVKHSYPDYEAEASA